MWSFLTWHLRHRPGKRRARAGARQLLIESLEKRLGPSTTTFAIIGDYGLAGQPESDVAALVHGWNPNVIITTGDNNYQTGSASTIDANVGQYYHDYISPYLGSYGPGAATNLFFPTLGHHDWGNTYPNPTGDQPYLNYFTSLPGNGRYYTFTMGLVQFFALDSDVNEPDGLSSTSTQATWLQGQLAASHALYKIVYDHDPPYSSSQDFASPQARWPYQTWGATAVISGHAHAYERLSEDNNFPYFIDGLGGEPEISSFDAIDPGSQVRYNADFGAMLVTADTSKIQFQFITRTGTLIDSYTVSAPVQPLTITPTTLPNWTVNQGGYSQTLSAAGGTGAKTFTSTGTLPPGLALSTAGVFSGTPTSAGTFAFTVTAMDTGAATGTQSYTVTINPRPGIATTALPGGQATVAYGQTINATGGTGSYTFTRTSGTVPSGLTLSSTGALSGTPTSACAFTFTVAVSDAVGATASQVFMITVSPGPFSQYQVAIMGSSTVQAGSGFNLTVQAADALGNAVTSYSGPATATATLSPASSGSSFPATVSVNGFGFGFLLVHVQKLGTYTITVSSGSFMGSTGPVTVTPGPVAGLAFAAQPVSSPTGSTLPAVSVQVVDAYGNVVKTDNTDTITISIANGPGNFVVGSTTTVTAATGVANFSALSLSVPGTYQLSAVLPNRFITSSAAFSVTPLQVVNGSFSGTPWGFSLQFNTAFLVNAATPVLYGQGFAATAPVPSVTLTQTQDAGGHAVSKPVMGSLVLDSVTNTITFLTTNTALEQSSGAPILADGVYTAVVHGTAGGDGFQALVAGGGYLDGLGTGAPGSGDYVRTFTVSAAHEDIVWVPATADGPGQLLSAPGMNRLGGGYPIYLSASAGNVTSVQATLNYNPALLSISGVTGVGFSLLGSSSPGHAVLQYNGPALAVGTHTSIGFLVATVPSGTSGNPMPYKAKDLLHLSNVVLNGGSIPAATGDALHLVAYVGDGDGDGAYTSNDAVLITRAALDTDSGFSAYPLVDPVIVADTDGDGFIPADAPLQANEAGVGMPAANLPTPPIPAGVVFQDQITRAALRAHQASALRASASHAFATNSTFAAPLIDMMFEGESSLPTIEFAAPGSTRHKSSGRV